MWCCRSCVMGSVSGLGVRVLIFNDRRQQPGPHAQTPYFTAHLTLLYCETQRCSPQHRRKNSSSSLPSSGMPQVGVVVSGTTRHWEYGGTETKVRLVNRRCAQSFSASSAKYLDSLRRVLRRCRVITAGRKRPVRSAGRAVDQRKELRRARVRMERALCVLRV